MTSSGLQFSYLQNENNDIISIGLLSEIKELNNMCYVERGFPGLWGTTVPWVQILALTSGMHVIWGQLTNFLTSAMIPI